MVKYSRFLIKNLIVKKTIYLLMTFFAILIFTLVAVQSNKANKMDEPYVNSIDTFAKFFPFLLSTCFTIMIVIFNFKSTEKDGSDLLIISKPIKRISVFYSKILITITSIIAFHIFAFIIYSISAATDSVATPSMIINFALSLAVGGLIVQFIVVSILIIIASFFNSISVIATGILFSAIIPITSLIITQVSRAKPTHFNTNERTLLDMSKVNALSPDKAMSGSEKKWTLDVDNVYNIRGMNSDGSSPELARYYQWQKNNWYPKVAKFDIWYQWGSFMEMFSSKSITSSNAIRDWVPSVGYLGIDENKLLNVDFEVNGTNITHKVAIFTKPADLNVNNSLFMQNDASKNDLPSYWNVYQSLLHKGFIRKKGVTLSTVTPDYSTLTEFEEHALVVFNRFLTIKELVSKIDTLVLKDNLPVVTKARFFSFLLDEINESKKADSSGNAPVDFAMYVKDEHNSKHWQEYVKPSTIRASSYVVLADKMIGFYLSKPYIESSTITIVWVSIMSFLFLVSGLSFFKRDIK